jgi:hypothetical protein
MQRVGLRITARSGGLQHGSSGLPVTVEASCSSVSPRGWPNAVTCTPTRTRLRTARRCGGSSPPAAAARRARDRGSRRRAAASWTLDVLPGEVVNAADRGAAVEG